MAARKPYLLTLLASDRIRHAEVDGRTLYAIIDVIGAMADGDADAAGHWASLKHRLPQLASLAEEVTAEADVYEGADLAGVLRIVQSLNTPKAEKVKVWLAQTAAERLEEIEDPEVAILRARAEYERRGYRREWIDARMRSISARHVLTSEWYKRGARESEAFSGLTRTLMEAAFGRDVERYRQEKGVAGGGGRSLRDAMTDLELSLLSLAETAAATLHRRHESQGVDALRADAEAAGAMVGQVRQRLEGSTGRSLPGGRPGDATAQGRRGESTGGRTPAEAEEKGHGRGLDGGPAKRV